MKITKQAQLSNSSAVEKAEAAQRGTPTSVGAGAAPADARDTVEIGRPPEVLREALRFDATAIARRAVVPSIVDFDVSAHRMGSADRFLAERDTRGGGIRSQAEALGQSRTPAGDASSFAVGDGSVIEKGGHAVHIAVAMGEIIEGVVTGDPVEVAQGALAAAVLGAEIGSEIDDLWTEALGRTIGEAISDAVNGDVPTAAPNPEEPAKHEGEATAPSQGNQPVKADSTPPQDSGPGNTPPPPVAIPDHLAPLRGTRFALAQAPSIDAPLGRTRADLAHTTGEAADEGSPTTSSGPRSTLKDPTDPRDAKMQRVAVEGFDRGHRELKNFAPDSEKEPEGVPVGPKPRGGDEFALLTRRRSGR